MVEVEVETDVEVEVEVEMEVEVEVEVESRCLYFRWFSQGFEAKSRPDQVGLTQAPPP